MKLVQRKEESLQGVPQLKIAALLTQVLRGYVVQSETTKRAHKHTANAATSSRFT